MHAWCLVLMSFCLSGAVALAGDPNPPPGPVAPTMKSLEQIEPRRPLSEVPGTVSALHRITEPGSYYLSSALFVPASMTAIEVDAPGVTIEMMGFEIAGEGELSRGIVLLPGPPGGGFRPGLAVRNGRFSFLGVAVEAQSGSAVELTDLTARDVGQAFWAGVSSLVSRCTTIEGGSGFQIGDHSVLTECRASGTQQGFSSGISCTLRDCTSSGAETYGFVVSGLSVLESCRSQGGTKGFLLGAETQATRCISHGASICGFDALSGGINMIACMASGCETGFSTAQGCVLEGCSAVSNIYGYTLSDSALFHSVAKENSHTGIIAGFGSSVRGCTATQNSDSGITSTGGGVTIADCTAVQNPIGIHVLGNRSHIANNHIVFASTTAIRVIGFRAHIEGNTIGESSGDGVQVLVGSGLVTGNTVGGVSGEAFSVQPGVGLGPVLGPADVATNVIATANYVLN